MRPALAIALIVAASPAGAQQTMCFTSGYPPNQVVTCNTTPPPDNSSAQYLQQSRTAFYNNLAAVIASRAAAAREERDQKRQMYQDAAIASADAGRCSDAIDDAKLSRNGAVVSYVQAKCAAAPTK